MTPNEEVSEIDTILLVEENFSRTEAALLDALRADVLVAVTFKRHAIKHLMAIYRHPHHYGTALCLTVFMLMIGHIEMAEMSVIWAYAVFENILGGAEPSA